MSTSRLTHERLLEVLEYDPTAGEFHRRWAHGLISQDRLKEVLDYNPKTGVFIWKQSLGSRAVVGTEAGALKGTGSGVYRYIRIDGEKYLANRLAWFYVHGRWPRLVRPRDGNSTNSAIDNLEDLGESSLVLKGTSEYRYIRIDGCDYLAARLAWFYVHRKWPDGVLRFRDGDRTNLAIANLRDTAAEPAYSQTDQGRYEVRKSAYERDRLRTKDLQYRKQFGISLADYERMLVEQNGKCAICGNPETGMRNGKVRGLAVDHCHDSGKVRGLLCGNCNPMIGYAKDDINILSRAIDYLVAHGVKREAN